MQLQFKSISEPTHAGKKWKVLFDKLWPNYKAWFLSNNTPFTADLRTSQEALKKYMPKMWPTYEHLCSTVNADSDIARFLTGFQPPGYVSGCAQVVIDADEIQLVRNYDYHPNLLEGTLLLSKWNKQKVIAKSDCIIGVLDGMNDAGLCVSLTFGGRKEIGHGFGIPFILRYVLEFCKTTHEAVKTLKSIPSHMSYNVTLVDKKGVIKTIVLAPDKKTLVTNNHFATNHQGIVDWPENAQFNKTVNRYDFIQNYLNSKNISSGDLAKAFLHPPLYNTNFTEGFGTLYTAVYQPEKLRMQLMWPGTSMEQSFDNFKEEQLLIHYHQDVQSVLSTSSFILPEPVYNGYSWQDAVVDSLVKSVITEDSMQKQEELRKRFMPDGDIAWEVIADYWDESIEN